MKLYFFPLAPNPTKVRLYLAEKSLAGASLDVEPIAVDLRAGEQKSPEHLARNPLGKLPVLEIEEGHYLTESLPIILFLEEQCPEPPLVGTTPRKRADTLNAERIAELRVLLPIANIVHATESPLGLPPNPAVADHFRTVLPAGLQWLDDRLADGRPFLMGGQPTVADCTLAAALQFGRFGKFDIDPSYAHIHRWSDRYRERPSARDVLVV